MDDFVSLTSNPKFVFLKPLCVGRQVLWENDPREVGEKERKLGKGYVTSLLQIYLISIVQ